MQNPARRSLRRRGRTRYVCEPLEHRLLLSVIQISGTTARDTIVISAHLQLGARWFVDYTIDGGATQHAGIFPGDTISVDTIANADGTTDTIDVLASPPNSISVTGHGYIDINTGAFNPDTLNLGDANGVQDVRGTMTLTSDYWNITADDSTDAAAPRTVSLSDGQLSGLAPGTISWPQFTSVLTLKMGSFGGSTLNDNGDNSPTTVIGNSQGADDAINLQNVDENFSIGAPSGSTKGLWNLNIDDSGFSNTTNFSLTLADESLTITNTSAQIGWAAGSVRGVSVTLPAQTNAFVPSTDVPTSVTGPGSSQVYIGNSSDGVQDILGNLTAHAESVFFLDNPDPVARSFQLFRANNGTDVTVDGLATATITYAAAFAQFYLWQNVSGGSVSVLGAGQPSGTTSILAYRSVSVTIGNPIAAPDVQGTLVAEGNGAAAMISMQIDDSADPVGRNVTVGATASNFNLGQSLGMIHGLTAGDIDYSATQTASPLIMDGGPGGNTFTINPLSANYNALGVALLLNTGAGDDSVDIKTNAVTVNGQAGNDSVTVDLTGQFFTGLGTLYPGPVTVDGGTGLNTLTVIQAAGATSGIVTSMSVTTLHQTTTYANVSTLELAIGPFTITADLNGLSLLLAGAAATFQSSQHLNALSLDATAQAMLSSSAAPWAKTIFCTALFIATGGKLDLTNNALQLNYATDPIASIRSYLASGYAGGAWNGPGIDSSSASQNASHATAIGYADSADGLVPGLPANTIELKYTVYGDANLDGTTNLPDLLTQVRHFGQRGSWDAGDFNFDNTVGLPDFMILARHFGQNVQTAAIVSAFAATQAQAAIASTPPARRRTRSVLTS